jgi:tetratricopeptide (TPR) repeat protein
MLYASQALIMQGAYTDALQIMQANILEMTHASGLMAYQSSWGGTLALLHRGEYGELLRVLRTVLETAKKNGNNLWFGVFTAVEAWLRTQTSDFEGARKLCESVLPISAGRPARTPRAVALLAARQAELGLGNTNIAREYFEQVEEMTGERFYLYWYWRLHAQLGLAYAWLESGDTTSARIKANCFLESVLSTSDPNMQVLAWEIKTKVEIAEGEWIAAGESIKAALSILEKRDVPLSAWRMHSTAWEFFRHQHNCESAESHRLRAEEGLLALARSFPEQEPLRAIFLASDPVRRVLSGAPETD